MRPFARLALAVSAAAAATAVASIGTAAASSVPIEVSYEGPDSVAAVATVTAFRTALASGDSAAVLRLLAPDVVIVEAGGVETLADYRAHHLPGDIAYARALPGVHTLKNVVVSGDVAWVTSTSVTEGQYNGRAVNSAGAELIVLARAKGGAPWMIRAVHWSSRRRTP